MLTYLNYDDMRKTRRSMVLASCATLTLGAVKFLSDSISVFGMEVTVSQVNMISAGRLICALLLFIYVFRLAPDLTELIKLILIERIETQKDHELSDLHQFHYGGDEDYYDGSPAHDFAYINARYENKSKQASHRLDFLKSIQQGAIRVTIDHGIPITLALSAITNPHSLGHISEMISHFEVTRGYIEVPLNQMQIFPTTQNLSFNYPN